MNKKFGELVIEVGKVSKEASGYLEENRDRLILELEGKWAGSLAGLMLWTEQPQGHDYWAHIAEAVGKLGWT